MLGGHKQRPLSLKVFEQPKLTKSSRSDQQIAHLTYSTIASGHSNVSCNEVRFAHYLSL